MSKEIIKNWENAWHPSHISRCFTDVERWFQTLQNSCHFPFEYILVSHSIFMQIYLLFSWYITDMKWCTIFFQNELDFEEKYFLFSLNCQLKESPRWICTGCKRNLIIASLFCAYVIWCLLYFKLFQKSDFELEMAFGNIRGFEASTICCL